MRPDSEPRVVILNAWHLYSSGVKRLSIGKLPIRTPRIDCNVLINAYSIVGRDDANEPLISRAVVNE